MNHVPFSGSYDFVGNVIYTIDPNGNRTDITYDFANRPTDVTGPAVEDAENGDVLIRPLTHTEYDHNGRVTDVTDPRGRVTHTGYDELGRASSVTSNFLAAAGSADRLVTEYQYDANGNLIKTIVKNWVDGTQRDQTTTNEYDPFNRKTSMAQADPDGTGPLTAPVTQYDYSRAGDLLTATDPLGHVTSYEYDRAGRKTAEMLPDPITGLAGGPRTTYEYDLNGSLRFVTDPLGKKTEYRYDAMNRKVREILPDPDGTGPQAASETQHFYDANGNQTKSIDPMSHAQTSVYDRANRPIAQTSPDPDGAGPKTAGTTTYGYDANGNLITVTDALGNSTGDTEHHSTLTTYDALNRNTDEYLPYEAGQPRSHYQYGYSLNGALVWRTDASDNTTRYTLDGLGRATAVRNQLNKSRNNVYDPAGNLVQSTDRNGRVIKCLYDDLNRKTAELWLDSGSNVIRTISFTYFADGKLQSAADSGGTTTIFTYDGIGRVKTVDTTLPADATKHYLTTYGYDANRRLTSMTGVVGTTTFIDLTYDYDDAGRLTTLIDHIVGYEKRVEFTYNSLGQYLTVSRYSDATGSVLVAAATYDHDDANRLLSMVYDLASPTTLNYAFDYDVMNRITDFTTPDGSSDLSYDNRGQLTGASLTDEDFAYDANGNRTSGGTLTGDDNRITEDAVYTYTYDDEGNLTSRTHKDGSGSDTFSWDYRNRLTGVTTRDGLGAVTLTAVYSYDAFDRRIRRTLSGSTALDRQYFYDGTTDGDMVLMLDGDGNIRRRELRGLASTEVFAEDRWIDNDTVFDTRWNLMDHEGSVRDVVNRSGTAVVNHIQYDSFGQIISQTAIGETPRIGYTGALQDLETGFLYLYHRYQDPHTGRFISQDPKGFDAGDANLYRYVGNDPYGRTDPLGLEERPFGQNKPQWKPSLFGMLLPATARQLGEPMPQEWYNYQQGTVRPFVGYAAGVQISGLGLLSSIAVAPEVAAAGEGYAWLAGANIAWSADQFQGALRNTSSFTELGLTQMFGGNQRAGAIANMAVGLGLGMASVDAAMMPTSPRFFTPELSIDPTAVTLARMEEAAILQARASELQQSRVNQFDISLGTTSVRRVRSRLTGTEEIWVSTEDRKFPAAWVEDSPLREGEKFVGGEGHAELTGDVRTKWTFENGELTATPSEWEILAGGSSRNVCLNCDKELAGMGLDIGGKEFRPAQYDKTPFRMFWKPEEPADPPAPIFGVEDFHL